jgi:hypothetical protein
MSALYVFIGLLIGSALGWFAAQWWRRQAGRDPIRKHPRGMEEKDPYRLNPAVLTRTEDACYRALLAVVSPEHTVLAKVRLADLLQVNYGAGDRAEAHARIGNKSLAFLICDHSLAPKLAVSLVPAAGDRTELQLAEFIERVCAKVGLPLITLPVTAAYPADEIRQSVMPHLARVSVGVAA